MHSGSRVVYPGRGVCTVAEVDSEFVRLRDKDGTILVPVQNVPQLLRPVASADEVTQVFEVLRESGEVPGRRPWRQHKQSIEEKLKGGSVVEVAEVFRDLHQKERLSYTERGFKMRALSLLSRELAASQGREEGEVVRDIIKEVGNA